MSHYLIILQNFAKLGISHQVQVAEDTHRKFPEFFKKRRTSGDIHSPGVENRSDFFLILEKLAQNRRRKIFERKIGPP